MRSVAAVAILAIVALGGCAADEPDERVQDEEPDVVDEPADNFTLEGHPEFCTGDNSGCDFWDELYHEYVVYDLDTTHFDVVIVPPAGVTTPDNLAASRQAVQAWGDGILELAAPWLQGNFSMDINAVGIDIPSIDVVQDPEIIVISSSAEGLVGIGLEPKQFACRIIGEEPLQLYGHHEHDGNIIAAADCTNTGFTCFAINVGAMDPRGLYDLIAHEVGHCLGAGHVGDAGDFRARYAPVDDIMSYQDDPQHVHCVSNLNVRTLEGVYAHLLDQPDELHLPYGSFYHMEPKDYFQVECDNPPGM